MDWLASTLRQYPEVSIFLALALGYWIGGLRIGAFSLGSVTGTLLMGVLIGQMHVSISSNVKATFFLMFLFAVGYGAGPEFFRGLRNEGVPQAIFAAVQCVASLVVAYAVAKALGYDVGQAAGLLAGSQTISGLLGTAAEAINKRRSRTTRRSAWSTPCPWPMRSRTSSARPGRPGFCPAWGRSWWAATSRPPARNTK